MAFSEPVRPSVTPCCIPLVHNRHSPGHKKKFEKKCWLPNQNSSTRSGVEVRDGNVFCEKYMAGEGHEFRPKYTVIFIKKSVLGASDGPCRLQDASTGSRITAGALLAFGDGVTIDTGRQTLDSSDFHSISERDSVSSMLPTRDPMLRTD